MEDGQKTCPRCAEDVKAAASVCRHCGYEFSISEPAAPEVAKKRGKGAGIGCLVIVLALIGIATCTSKLTQPGSRLASSPMGVDSQLQGIHDKVANDAFKQYQIAKNGGSAMDRCVQAGLVAAAYLQAQKQLPYNNWKIVEAQDCEAAGVPR